jgi:hypothetical protein
MKTARSFVRQVRSKSPFRSRKRAENLVVDIQEKERTYLQLLNATSSIDSRSTHQDDVDDVAEIEVVLEPSAIKPTGSSRYSGSHRSDKASRKVDYLPDLAASSTTSTDEPPLTNAQAAAQRFMERQQRIAAGNRRKTFRDRFMRPSKNTTASPPSPSPARSINPMRITMRGSRSSGSSSSPLDQTSQVQERGRGRGRSRERSDRGMPPTSGRSNPNLTGNSKNYEGAEVLDSKMVTPARPVYQLYTPEVQPVTIELGSQSSRISELSSPAAMIRKESLGTESIRGVRQALKKMELELAAAGDAGKRVPRDKILSALNFVANALHKEDQKLALVKELDAWIDESVMGGDIGFRVDDEDDDDDYDSEEETSSDDDGGSEFDLDAFNDGGESRVSKVRGRANQSSFQDLFQRLGKFFTINDEDKSAVYQAMADLLLAEQPRRSTRRSTKGGDESASDDDSIGNFDPLSCNLQDPECEPLEDTRGRSWWRHHGGKDDDGNMLMKKENLYPKTEGSRAFSPESKLSVPSPTGKGNPRSLNPKARTSKDSGSRRSVGRSRGQRKPTGLKERKSSYMKTGDSETSVGWSTFGDSDFWRQGDRLTIPHQPKASTQQTKFANPHHNVSYTDPRTEHDRFESDFLRVPNEEDEFSVWEDCLHPAENTTKNRRQYV